MNLKVRSKIQMLLIQHKMMSTVIAALTFKFAQLQLFRQFSLSSHKLKFIYGDFTVAGSATLIRLVSDKRRKKNENVWRFAGTGRQWSSHDNFH